MNTQPETVRIDLSIGERVASGVAELDRRMPGWEKLIDLEALDLADCCLCVLGQLFGDFDEAPNELRHEASYRLGFDLEQYDEHGRYRGYERYEFLGDEWRRVIGERRSTQDGAET